jgi:hypothetical protein
MEYYLQLLEALDEYDAIMEQEPVTNEMIQEWCARSSALERRIFYLTEKCRTSS